MRFDKRATIPCIMDKRMILIVIGIFVVCVLVGVALYGAYCDAQCSAEKERGETKNYAHISADSFQAQLDGAHVIDVRTPEEYVEGHITGASLIDIHAADFKQRIGQLEKDVPYYVYCRTGGRSREAVNIMKAAGFAQVYGLDGGIRAWTRAGFPVE
jgi:phage shock protein E